MIRFIDLRGQSTGGRFAFFDTITDRFVDIDGAQVWASRQDLEDTFDETVPDYQKNRLRGFLPAWASDEPTNEELW